MLVLLSHPREHLVVPGKLYEYLGARRPVLAAVPPGTEMDRLLRAHGDARVPDPYDVRTTYALLRTLLEEHRRGALQAPRVDERTVAPLTRRAATARLAGILDAVAAGGPRR